MKSKRVELDVDFIGGQSPLTKQEEIAISEFIRSRKVHKSKRSSFKSRITSRKKIIT